MNKKSYDNRNVGTFFLLTFTISWLIWLPYVLHGLGILTLSEAAISLMTLAVMLGAFAPLIAALICIGRIKGKSGIKEFFRESFDFKTRWFFYILALLLPLLVTAAAHYIVNSTGIDNLPGNLFPENISMPIPVLVIPYFLLILIAGGGQEEFGWRGFAQGPMQEKYGVLMGSALIGIIWGLWHLPLWFMPEEGHAYYSFAAFLVYTISTAITIGWLYNASGKKLIIPLLIHTMGNVGVPFFPIMHLAEVPQPGYWVWVLLNALMALVITIIYSKKIKSQLL